MNERIVDLYEQASLFASEEENPTKSYKDRVMLKFAELIVEECTTVIEQNLFQGIGWNTSRAVRRHFGIDNDD